MADLFAPSLPSPLQAKISPHQQPVSAEHFPPLVGQTELFKVWNNPGSRYLRSSFAG